MSLHPPSKARSSMKFYSISLLRRTVGVAACSLESSVYLADDLNQDRILTDMTETDGGSMVESHRYALARYGSLL
jgi:hypothetical protein